MKNLCKHSPNTVRFQCPTAGHTVCHITGNCTGLLNLIERSPFSTGNLLQWSHGTEILRSVILACHGIKRHMCFLECILLSHIATRPLPLHLLLLASLSNHLQPTKSLQTSWLSVPTRPLLLMTWGPPFDFSRVANERGETEKTITSMNCTAMWLESIFWKMPSYIKLLSTTSNGLGGRCGEKEVIIAITVLKKILSWIPPENTDGT